MKNIRLNLKGLVAAVYAPLHSDGTVNPYVVEKTAAHLSGWGCTGVFVNGTTGESLSLTVEERKALAARWCDAAKGSSLKVIVHVGHNSISAASELAGHAEAAGADAIGMMPPCYLRPGTVDDLTACCKKVAEQAPDTPFYYYHIPDLTGVELSMTEFLERASAEIPTLAGIKYTHSDLAEYLQCLNFRDKAFDLFFGRDESLLAALALGAQSAVGSTYNFAAPVYHRIIKKFSQGDLDGAREEQLFIADMVELLKSYGFLPASKALMSMIGLDMGPVRLPLSELSDLRKSKLKQELETLGFFARIR
ncbi:MAG: dihydrodipicolinate synthase family protein [Acidobacteriota bacterium]